MVARGIFYNFKGELYAFKMKNSKFCTLVLCIFLFGSTSIYAQQISSEPQTVKRTATLKIDKSNIKVQRHTVMSRFDSELASSEEERMQLKQQRVADTEWKLSVLDTLNVSERKKRKLLRDLKYSPYSERLHKAILVDTEFEDTSSNNR